MLMFHMQGLHAHSNDQYDCCWPSVLATNVCGTRRLCNTTHMSYIENQSVCTCKNGRSGPLCTCAPGFTYNKTQDKCIGEG